MSFVINDYNIIKNNYETTGLFYVGITKTISDTLKSIAQIFSKVLQNDITFCWFGDFRGFLTTFFCKLLGKNSVIIIGGYEVVNMPEINYGGLLTKTSIWNMKYILKNANRIISISDNSYLELNRNYKIKHPNRISIIHNGVKISKFNPKGSKENIVITVGIVKKSNLQRKGLEDFVRAAAYLPDTKFYLIGKHVDESIDFLRSISTSNVIFTNYIKDSELLQFMQRAKVYVQASAHEGFGISTAEAMLCECVPVVTDRGAIPEVVGDCGIYVSYNDPESISKAVFKGFSSDLGKSARNRICDNFNLELRKEKLLRLIEEV